MLNKRILIALSLCASIGIPGAANAEAKAEKEARKNQEASYPESVVELERYRDLEIEEKVLVRAYSNLKSRTLDALEKKSDIALAQKMLKLNMDLEAGQQKWTSLLSKLSRPAKKYMELVEEARRNASSATILRTDASMKYEEKKGQYLAEAKRDPKLIPLLWDRMPNAQSEFAGNVAVRKAYVERAKGPVLRKEAKFFETVALELKARAADLGISGQAKDQVFEIADGLSHYSDLASAEYGVSKQAKNNPTTSQEQEKPQFVSMVGSPTLAALSRENTEDEEVAPAPAPQAKAPKAKKPKKVACSSLTEEQIDQKVTELLGSIRAEKRDMRIEDGSTGKVAAPHQSWNMGNDCRGFVTPEGVVDPVKKRKYQECVAWHTALHQAAGISGNVDIEGGYLLDSNKKKVLGADGKPVVIRGKMFECQDQQLARLREVFSDKKVYCSKEVQAFVAKGGFNTTLLRMNLIRNDEAAQRVKDYGYFANGEDSRVTLLEDLNVLRDQSRASIRPRKNHPNPTAVLVEFTFDLKDNSCYIEKDVFSKKEFAKLKSVKAAPRTEVASASPTTAAAK